MDSAKVLVITGNLNRDILVTKLEEARAIVDCLQVYKTEPVDLSGDPAAAEYRRLGADAVLFASSSSAQCFVGPGGGTLALGRGKGAPQREHRAPDERHHAGGGLGVDFEAATPGIDELVVALVQALKR